MTSLNVEVRRCCCREKEGNSAPPFRYESATGRWGRCVVELAGWLIPGTLLALFPKCPLCVAGYVALATGLGISFAAATYLRWLLLVVCVGTLAFMTMRWGARRRTTTAQRK